MIRFSNFYRELTVSQAAKEVVTSFVRNVSNVRIVRNVGNVRNARIPRRVVSGPKIPALANLSFSDKG